jgi:hypothetical protein
MEKEQLEIIFNKMCSFAGKKVNDSINPPQVVLITPTYDVYNTKPGFDIYINSDNEYWGNEKVEEVFNSNLRGLARTAQLVKSVNYRIFLNTDVPERYDSLVSKADEFKTELENTLSRSIKSVKYDVEYVMPENTNWIPNNQMSIKIIVNLYLKDPNDDELRDDVEELLSRTLNRMVKESRYRDFKGYSYHLNVEELDEDDFEEEISENRVMSTELSENKVSNFLTKHSSSIKKTFLEELRNSGSDAKKAYINLMKLVNSDEPISEEEREKIGNELKEVFKNTLKRLGMVGLMFIPGGTTFMVLRKIFRDKKSKTKELPYEEEINESNRVRVFSESVDDEDLKWHRDREDRLIEVIDGNDWEIQFDNELPKKLTPGTQIIIPEGVYHRVIKGSSELKIKVHFLN